jgi:DMSO/TMAO reductase YedYZ molybdopterin-dependent catalytic subunit
MDRRDGPAHPEGEPEKTAPGGEVSGPTADRTGNAEAPSAESAATPSASASRETGESDPPEETPVPAAVERTTARKTRRSLADRLAEPEETAVEMPASAIRSRTRRDFLLFGAGALAAAGGLRWLLPDETREQHLTPALRDRLDSLEARLGATPQARENLLNRALTFDDDVAEALYSADRSVRTYSRSQVTPLRNNYNGATPGPSYIPGWTLSVSGLASERTERLAIGDLLSRFQRREQVTRICCVEGWSAVAWWSGLRFSDFLHAYPPAAGSLWAKLESAVHLDGSGRPDPYYVSIDLATARHAQTLLATHLSGRPLSVEHGAPLRLLAPMKLGLKNIKAITSIEFTEEEPEDYWNERGYSKYDGL